MRFIGGAIAPWLAGKLAEWYSPQAPFYVGAGVVVLSIAVLYSGHTLIETAQRAVGHDTPAQQADLEVAIAGAMDEP